MKNMKPEEKIYKAFYQNKKKWIYFSELKLYTKMSNSSLQNALKKLIKEKEIQEKKETSNIFYKLSNKNKKASNFTNFDFKRIENLNFGVKVPLKDFLEQIPKQIKSVLLFGSASRKQEKKDSDIDLIIILHKFQDERLQKLYEKEIKQKIIKIQKKVNSRSNYPIKSVFINSEAFKTSEDYLILQTKKTGFPVFGNFEYYNEN